jgi:transposase
MAYSIDYKMRALAYKDAGHSFRELYEAFNIPSTTYYVWMEKLAQGVLGVKVKQTRRRKINPEELKRVIEERPDAYLREIAEQFGCAIASVHARLKKLKITYKKRRLVTRKSPRN